MSLVKIGNFDIDLQYKAVRGLRLALRRDGSLRMSAPFGTDKATIEQFVNSNHAWIERKTLQAKQCNERERQRTHHHFVQGELFTYLGHEYPLHIIYGEKGSAPAQVELSDGAFHLNTPPESGVKEWTIAFNRWYFNQFNAITHELIDYWLKVMKEKPLAAVRYKNLTSRWGSCKPSERIVCFNLRLIFYTRECIEAVVVHELCHLKEKTHNARFHALMAYYLPDYKERDKLLR